MRALSVEQIATRLTDRFRLLTGGDRTALPRQQTLRALIDWSYDLLDEDERVLFRRLAVFAGGFTLEAAEAVAGGGDLDGPRCARPARRELVEKSLVVHGSRERPLPDAGDRSAIRAGAARRIGRSGTRPHAARRVSTSNSPEGASRRLLGPQQGAWLARFDLERENMLAVHAWCDRADEGAALGLRLVHAVKPYLLTRGVPGARDCG